MDEKRLKELIKIAESHIIRFEPVEFNNLEDGYDLHKALKLLESLIKKNEETIKRNKR